MILMISGANILVGNRGELKVADFGLARPMPTSKDGEMTGKVVTLHYRHYEEA